MKTVAQAMRSANIDALDARVLLAAVLRVSQLHLVAHSEQVLTRADEERFCALVERRAAGEPVAYLTGEREFFSRSFHVTPAVLIPRPETELLVELALERLPHNSRARVLDLGTGSGCIAVSLALSRGGVRVTATDASAAALGVACGNAQRLGAGNIQFAQGHWFDAFDAAGGERFDLIVSNPPYVATGDAHLQQGDVRFEPASALTSGVDGLDAIRLIAASARRHLSHGGWLMLEHGYDQALRCRELFARAGFSDVQSARDLAGIERVTLGQSLQ
jgi:release factor glutamine methyltransferase